MTYSETYGNGVKMIGSTDIMATLSMALLALTGVTLKLFEEDVFKVHS
jgi:hypothetical protein